MTRAEINDHLAAQATPDHVRTLVHAILIGGEDFASEVSADIPDIGSDAERESLVARALGIVAEMRALDPEPAGMRTLQEIAALLGEAYWVPRAWVFQGAPHNGYGSQMTCDPARLAAWCEAKAFAITDPRYAEDADRFRGFAQRLSYAARQTV